MLLFCLQLSLSTQLFGLLCNLMQIREIVFKFITKWICLEINLKLEINTKCASWFSLSDIYLK